MKENDRDPPQGRLPVPGSPLLRIYDRPRNPALYRPFLLPGTRAKIEERVAETWTWSTWPRKPTARIKSFSGGERQRLGIAQAQVNYPDLLILDEPAASLDPLGRHDVLEVMERLRKYTTIFYSTHILDDVQRVSDTVAILNKGRLVAQGPIEELLAGGQAATFTLTVKGDSAAVEARLRSEPWVTGIVNSLEERNHQLANPGHRPGPCRSPPGAPGPGGRRCHGLRVWA